MNHYTDDELMAKLHESLLAGLPHPPGVTATSEMTFAWRTVDADLAALSYDSSMEELTVRSGGEVRTLSFELDDDVRIDLRIDAERTRLVGQIEPGAEGVAELAHRDGLEVAEVDDFGVFVFEAIAAGPVSIRVKVGDRSVRTEWFLP